MRVALWTTNIPPPKNEVDDTAEIEVEDDKHVGSYQCILKLNNEEICGRRFKRLKDLNKHMMKSMQHEQTPMPCDTAFVCSNQCPWCHRIFKNKTAAVAHVSRAFRAETCQEAKIKDKQILMRGQRVKSDYIFYANFVMSILTH